MVSIILLWLPILLSAVIVFVVSSILHMVLPYHRSDFSKIPKEKEAAEFDLVQTRLERDPQVDLRRAHLRADDRRDVCMAVACIDE